MRKISAVVGLGVTLGVAGAFSGCSSRPASEKPSDEKKVDFATEIRPILDERCIMCHNRKTMPERTSFENGALALKGDRQGPVILPGNAAGSRLVAAVSSPDFHGQAMPPVSLRVKPQEIQTIRRWIDQGAHWPEGPSGEIVPHSIPME